MPSPSKSTAERKLNRDQLLNVLARLKEEIGTWEGHRLYALAATIPYTGLHPGIARKLRIEQFDLDAGIVRVPRHPNSKEKDPREIKFDDPLKQILAAWFPLRLAGKIKRTAQRPYGSRLADDGRTLIPDEMELESLAKMRRWRSDGWSGQRIARELDATHVPTRKGGAKWNGSVVNEILDRGVGNDGTKTKPADHGWVFPGVSGKGHLSLGESWHEATLRLRAAGESQGIERLTFESLCRFHLEYARLTLDLGWSTPGVVGTFAIRSGVAASNCPVELRGEGLPIRVYGRDLDAPPLTGITYALVEFAVERFNQVKVCEYDELDGRTTSTSDRPEFSLTSKLKQPGFEPLARVIKWNGRKGNRGGQLWIIDPGPDS